MGDPRRLTDGAAGDWINKRLLDHGAPGVRVGSVVPIGFSRVVRVLHPAGGGRSWADVARSSGRAVHPLVQWPHIAPHFDGSGRDSDVDPEEGSIAAADLSAVLEHCPAHGEVINAVWDGFGSWNETVDQSALMPGWGGRSYRLFATEPVALMHWPGMTDSWPQSANLIWPADHSWCIATEIDWDSTLVACSERVANDLVGDERLEAFDVRYDDDLSWRGDIVNPAPAWLR